MTEPVITDAEVDALFAECCIDSLWQADRVRVKRALAAFLAKRVPDALPGHKWDEQIDRHATGFNACRDAVLRGKG